MVKRIAMLFGVVFILVGILGFFAPGGMSMGMDGKLLGLFPINLLHNCVHLLFGIWGLLAARTFEGAVTYAKVGGIIYLVLAAVGLPFPTPLNLVPIGGNDVYLHALLGIVLAGVGFTAKSDAPATAAAAA